jgi:hypothetical protein
MQARYVSLMVRLYGREVWTGEVKQRPFFGRDVSMFLEMKKVNAMSE